MDYELTWTEPKPMGEYSVVEEAAWQQHYDWFVLESEFDWAWTDAFSTWSPYDLPHYQNPW